MSEISGLNDHTGYWMRLVSNAVSQGFARKVEAQGVTVAEWVFLRALHDEEAIGPATLADKMGMTRGAISKLADRLLVKGLVLRCDNQIDRRAHSLSLTVQGRAKVPALARLADLNDAEFFGALSEQDRTELDRILKSLAINCGLTAIPMD